MGHEAGDGKVEKFGVATPAEGFVDITDRVWGIVRRAGVQQGICQIFVPHTTAGLTINENADPDVRADLLLALNRMVPDLSYRHGEGNSPAHVKSSLMGCSLTVPIAGGELLLGTWQGIYLCEFDGPRRREVIVQAVGN